MKFRLIFSFLVVLLLSYAPESYAEPPNVLEDVEVISDFDLFVFSPVCNDCNNAEVVEPVTVVNIAPTKQNVNVSPYRIREHSKQSYEDDEPLNDNFRRTDYDITYGFTLCSEISYTLCDNLGNSQYFIKEKTYLDRFTYGVVLVRSAEFRASGQVKTETIYFKRGEYKTDCNLVTSIYRRTDYEI